VKENSNNTADKLKNAGEKMQSVGCLLTILITVPIALTLFLGPLGLGISIIIIVIWFASKKK
jgi:hypothetical protein